MTHPKDDRREATEGLITLGLNMLFLALTALLFWPLDKAALALLWAKGYAVYWLAVGMSVLLLSLLERLFRVDIDTHYKVYVGLNLVVSAVLVVGWSAFGALAVGRAATGSTVWLAGVLYLVGGLASYVAFIVEMAFYKGGLYKVVTLPLALVSYLLFAVWPTVGWTLYGWFFEFFGMGR